jgi:hypothetical protein
MHPAAFFSGRKNVPVRNPFPISGGNIPLFGLLSHLVCLKSLQRKVERFAPFPPAQRKSCPQPHLVCKPKQHFGSLAMHKCLLSTIPANWVQTFSYKSRNLRFGSKPLHTLTWLVVTVAMAVYSSHAHAFHVILLGSALYCGDCWWRRPRLHAPEQLLLPNSKPFVKRFGVSIHQLQQRKPGGNERKQSHTRIFMAHGFGANSLQFGICMPLLAKLLSAEVIAYDHLGRIPPFPPIGFKKRSAILIFFCHFDRFSSSADGTFYTRCLLNTCVHQGSG